MVVYGIIHRLISHKKNIDYEAKKANFCNIGSCNHLIKAILRKRLLSGKFFNGLQGFRHKLV